MDPPRGLVFSWFVGTHMVLHSVPSSVYSDDFRVVQQSIQQSCRQHVITKEGAPFCKVQITSENDRSEFVVKDDITDISQKNPLGSSTTEILIIAPLQGSCGPFEPNDNNRYNRDKKWLLPLE